MDHVVASGRAWEACGGMASVVSRTITGDPAMGGGLSHTESLLLSLGYKNV